MPLPPTTRPLSRSWRWTAAVLLMLLLLSTAASVAGETNNNPVPSATSSAPSEEELEGGPSAPSRRETEVRRLVVRFPRALVAPPPTGGPSSQSQLQQQQRRLLSALHQRQRTQKRRGRKEMLVEHWRRPLRNGRRGLGESDGEEDSDDGAVVVGELGWDDEDDESEEKGDRDCDDFGTTGSGGSWFNGSTWLSPCRDDPSETGSGLPVVDGQPYPEVGGGYPNRLGNEVWLQVFVALPPNFPSRGALVTKVLSVYLNATDPHFRIWLRESARRNKRRRRWLQRRLEGQDGQGGGGNDGNKDGSNGNGQGGDGGDGQGGDGGDGQGGDGGDGQGGDGGDGQGGDGGDGQGGDGGDGQGGQEDAGGGDSSGSGITTTQQGHEQDDEGDGDEEDDDGDANEINDGETVDSEESVVNVTDANEGTDAPQELADDAGEGDDENDTDGDDDGDDDDDAVDKYDDAWVLWHHHTNPELVQQGDWWWWKYDISYECFLGSNATSLVPVTDYAVLTEVQDLLHQALQSGMDSGTLYDWMTDKYEGTFGALDFTTNYDDVASDASSEPLPQSNQVVFSVYIAFPPLELSRRSLVTDFLGLYISNMTTEYRLYGESNDTDVAVTAEGQEGANGSSRLLQRGDNNSRRRVLVHNPWDMYHQSTYSDLLRKGPVWWWEYDLVYRCYWADTHKPVTNATALEHAASDLKRIVDSGLATGSIYTWLQENYEGGLLGIVNMTTDPAVLGHHPSASNSASGDPDYPDELVSEFMTPLDPNEWDLSRYLGLSLFLGTVVVTFVLMQLAAYRHRALTKQELWGSLGTERGVEELLKTGWKIKGSHMEIYDKSKLGYDDDQGSMLIGGFEQREAICGAEITVTHPESETIVTPETHHYSFHHGTSSEFTPPDQQQSHAYPSGSLPSHAYPSSSLPFHAYPSGSLPIPQPSAKDAPTATRGADDA